jgi:hypothetical protein
MRRGLGMKLLDCTPGKASAKEAEIQEKMALMEKMARRLKYSERLPITGLSKDNGNWQPVKAKGKGWKPI